MQTESPVEVKVVYSASKRRRRPPVVHIGPSSAGSTKLMVVGLISAAMAVGMYYATWWKADPELRAMVFLHTPLVGLDFDGVSTLMSKAIAPDDGVASEGPASVGAAEDVAAAQLVKAAQFVITILGWEAISTLSILVLALLSGGLIARADAGRLRRAAVIMGLIALGLVVIAGLWLWSRYERFEPKQLRTDVAALVVCFGLLGLMLRRGGCKLGRLAAFLLILSAAGSAYTLNVLVEFGAVKLEDLPWALLPCMAAVFVAHSLWAWLLLMLAPRLGR
jgi:hypothetical protein